MFGGLIQVFKVTYSVLGKIVLTSFIEPHRKLLVFIGAQNKNGSAAEIGCVSWTM